MGAAPESRLGASALRGELRDLLVLETRLHARIESELAKGVLRDRPAARGLLERLEPRLHAHLSALQQALQRLRGSEPVLRRALAASLGRLVRWAEPQSELPEAAGDLCEIYALLSNAAAGYLVLESSARALGDGQTLALAERHADDAGEFLDEIALLLSSRRPPAPDTRRDGCRGSSG